jgi:hypothetical protein
VCLGAGSITKWAYALPEQLSNPRAGGDPLRVRA